ncbi:MAG: RNA polymerase sigma factor [Akkermansia sp.]
MQEELLQQEQEAVALSWEPWLKVYADKLLLFARQQSRTMEDAEDILQESLVRLARKEASGEFVGGQEAWLPYVYTSIRRLAVDYGRKEDRRGRREELSSREGAEESWSDTPWLQCDSDDEDLREKVEGCLKKLPPKFSEVIVLKIWGEQTFQQIADTLEISLNTVASRYRYGIDLLRKSMVSHRDDFNY